MSEILVEDDSTYPASITVPEDGDARNAASVVVSFQALANRTAYFLAKLGVWITGGTLELPAITLTAPIGGSLTFGTNTALVVNRNVSGPLFANASTGRANKKVTTYSGSTNTTVNPITHDELHVTPGAALDVQIAAGTYVTGDHVTVRNYSISHAVTLKNPGGTTMAVIDPIGAGYAQAIYDGSAWKLGDFRTAA